MTASRISFASVLFFVFIIFTPFLSPVLMGQGKKNDVFSTKRSKVDISSLELRLRLMDFYVRFIEEVEVSADKIFFDTADPQIKKAALMWKIYGISAMNKAINMPDLIAGFFNAWPLSKQLIHFFNEGKGRAELGTYSEDVLAVCVELEKNLDQIIIEMTSMENHSELERTVQEWADKHPIEDFYFSRVSTMNVFAKWIGEENFGLGKSVATITEEVIGLSSKLNLYVDLVPRQARWQADYAILTYLQDSSLTGDLSTIATSIERVSRIIELMPEIIEFNREATLLDIDQQREESLRFLLDERIAVIKEIRKERIEVIDKIIHERINVIEELKNEREIVLDDVRAISEEVVHLSGLEIERIVHMVLWRFTIMSIIIGAFIVLGVILYRKL